MKIFAGEAFHHRKPMHAPMHAGGDHGEVPRVAHLVAPQRDGACHAVTSWQLWLDCHVPMSTYAANTRCSPRWPGRRGRR